MQKTIAQEMMDEFLQRQKQYDFIYRKNEIYERDNASKPQPIQKYHKLRDAVYEAHDRYNQQRKLKRIEQKRPHLQSTQLTQRQLLRTENEKKKESSKEVLSLNFTLLLAIILPFIGLFGLMIWVTSQ